MNLSKQTANIDFENKLKDEKNYQVLEKRVQKDFTWSAKDVEKLQNKILKQHKQAQTEKEKRIEYKYYPLSQFQYKSLKYEYKYASYGKLCKDVNKIIRKEKLTYKVRDALGFDIVGLNVDIGYTGPTFVGDSCGAIIFLEWGNLAGEYIGI